MPDDELLTVAEAARLCRVKPTTIYGWKHRGLLPVARGIDGKEVRDERKRPLYWRLDVARAEHRTREAARRILAA